MILQITAIAGALVVPVLMALSGLRSSRPRILMSLTVTEPSDQ